MVVSTIPAAGHPTADEGLLLELVRRQPMLAATNLVIAALFVVGCYGSASSSALAAWGATVALIQAVRLVLWRQ